ncbi:hypothetical protein [Azospirillum sp. Sh1]|uniref:hypothetical protein n=1 Tax=Azospirillum sp. Sh1 TaxID=2607285 RepID=UPI0011EE615F|nr:hypothetical protein [Azospirillum sp. Sh1]KAA0573492.1 hypothetical protein FZ029_21185 [Azospirillum sp. Sh1]
MTEPAPTLPDDADGLTPTVVIPAVKRPVIPNPDDTFDASGVVTHEELPEVLFPTFVRLASDALTDFTGVLGSIVFKDGISTEPHSYQTVMALAAGGGWPVEDVRTGIRLSPLSEDRAFRVPMASREWNDGMPYPDHVEFPAARAEAPAAPEAPATDAPAEEGLLDAVARAVQVRTALCAVRDAKGARFLRQLCEERGLPTARSGDDMVDTLAGVLTLDEAKALLS